MNSSIENLVGIYYYTYKHFLVAFHLSLTEYLLDSLFSNSSDKPNAERFIFVYLKNTGCNIIKRQFMKIVIVFQAYKGQGSRDIDRIGRGNELRLRGLLQKLLEMLYLFSCQLLAYSRLQT